MVVSSPSQLGEKDEMYYASRFLAALARPVAGASIAQYADAIDRLVWHTADSAA